MNFQNLPRLAKSIWHAFWLRFKAIVAMSRSSTPPHPPLCQISLYRKRIITADANDAMVINIQKYFDDCNIYLTTVISHAWTPCKHVKQKANSRVGKLFFKQFICQQYTMYIQRILLCTTYRYQEKFRSFYTISAPL